MLERSHMQDFPERVASDTRIIDLDRLLGALLRQWRVIAACIGIGVALGVVYLAFAPRSYFAGSEILIDQNQQELVTDVTAQTSTVVLEAEVLNQTEVLRSSRIARAVVEAEHLDTDPDFLNPPPSFGGKLSGLVFGLLGRGAPAAVTSVPVEIATQIVMKGVVVDRVGRSSVLGVGFVASTPELAYRIANAYGQAFIKEQLNTDATTQAATWLQQQLTQLGENRRQASDALEAFRKQSGHTVAEDQNLADQRMQALTGQLVIAQSDTAHARALSTQLQAAVDAGPQAAGNNVTLLAATGPQGQSDQKTTDVIAQYASTVRRIGEVTAAFGADHPQLAVLKREQQALSDQIYAQLQQLNDRYANDLAVAERREAALRQDMQDEGQKAADSNQTQVRLNELQQKASALEVLYNSFLSRYEETLQRQSFPITSARIITEPVLPKDASAPRGSLTLAAAALVGGFLGLCFAALNELRERSFRLGTQISRDLGLHFIGYLPHLQLRRGRGRRAAKGPLELQDVVRGQVLGSRSNATVTAFAETLKATRIALDARRHSGRAVVTGVTSILPGEGKTTYGVALAEMIAASGSRVLLIDGDLRHPAASRLAAPTATAGLIDAAEGRPWRGLVQVDDRTGLAVLPAATTLEDPLAADPLSSGVLGQIIHEAREAFDYVVIDLPPLSPMVDALSVLPLTDGFVLVTEWGRTPRRLVASALEREPQLETALIGVVLNKVNFDRLARYSELGDSERYISAYDSYYRVHAVAEP
ncbi:MAG TPA: Wzz/FepE/Etk N-terminal domain-containing protein [Devosia sp.]|nr:Wzz/FepE/Etk N-terminal domain-containing protein [Devosia sp.]